ncbi:MAG: aminopeptidase, partial [Sphaerochaetaceae bacterium]|nr:aminopeptidase [Sphaerochaetaceae bacterium]
MKDIELMKREYARMIVNQGINLEKGQSLMIKTSLACYPFASEVGQAAYEKGATHVEIRVDDLRLLNSRLSAQDDEKALSYIPPFFENEDEVMIEEGWAYVRIDNTDERDVLKNADSDKLALYSRANSLFHRKARIARMSNVVPWCVVCVPSDT